MKYLLVILDGAADRPSKTMDGKTPLEKAHKPNIDSLGEMCSFGRIKLFDFPPESDEALLAIFGYPIKKTFRGSLEALGLGINVGPESLCFRVNLATQKDGVVLDRRVGRSLSIEEGKKIEKEINRIKIQGASFEFRSFGYRGALCFNSKSRLSDKVSNTDEAYSIFKGFSKAGNVRRPKMKKVEPLNATKKARYTAELVNEFLEKAHALLEESEVNKARARSGKLPANAMLLRDASLGLPKVKKLTEIYKISFGAIAQMPVEIGIAKLLGMNIYKANGYSYRKLLELTKKALKKEDFVYVHIKGPDEYGHDGDFFGKMKSIEQIDREFFSGVVGIKSLKVGVTCDHATPCALKAHAKDPVPFLIHPGSQKISRFSEKECKKGKVVEGGRFLKYFIGKINNQ